MRLIDDLLYAAKEAIHEKAESARAEIHRRAVKFALTVMAVAILLMGAGFLLASAFLAIQSALGSTLAALLTGSGAVLVAIVLMSIGRLVGR